MKLRSDDVDSVVEDHIKRSWRSIEPAGVDIQSVIGQVYIVTRRLRVTLVSRSIKGGVTPAKNACNAQERSGAIVL